MHTVDMPLEELLNYYGTNPKPADFDRYWERAIQELDRQSLEYELVPSKYKVRDAELYDLYFTGVGNARIHGRFLKPANLKEKAPAVAIFHGYSGHNGYWFEKLPYVCNGMAVAAIDVRGQGGQSEDTLQISGSTYRGHIVRGVDEKDPDKLFYRNVFLDAVQTVRILKSMPFIDCDRIGVKGASQGGGIATACAALEPSVKAVMIGAPFLSDYKRVSDLGLDKKDDPYVELSLYFRLRDPMHLREQQFFEKLGYIDAHHFAGKIRAKTIFFSSLMDTTCPPSTQFAVYNNIKAPKQLVAYPDFCHEPLYGADDQVLEFFFKNL